MSRRTTGETSELLLDVGLRMLHERGLHVAVTHIRLSDVAAAAGLTTGAAYRCWPSQDAFHRDLAVAAVEWHGEDSISHTIAEIRDMVDADAPLAEVIRVGAATNVHRYPEHGPFLTTVALRGCAGADTQLAAAARDRLEGSTNRFAALYAAMLHRYGRRMRTAFTVVDAAKVLAALAEGFHLQAMAGTPHPTVDRPDLGPGVGAEWTLMACAVEAILEYFTEPDPDAVAPERSP